MNEPDTSHPTLADLAAFDAGSLPPGEGAAIERHLAECAECGRHLDDLPEDPFVALVRASAATPAGDASTLVRPTDSSSAQPEVPSALAGHPRYRILETLGAGGMGVVYKAVHRLMDRVVALKVPHRRYLDHPGFVERFRQEARAAARLVHPHIVLAHDAEQAGDLPFLVMEYVAGTTLDRVAAQRGPLPVAEACHCVRQAALGLQHAHEQGMIHRDVKPANLLRTPAGVVKVLDFGLAHLARQESDNAMSVTPAGAVVGTPDYTAPEQARDPRSADARADVYGLGCTLYFLLAGRPPFPGGTVLGKLLAHQDQTPPPLTQLRADVPAALAGLVDHMLAKEPAQRPQSAAEVARLLAPFAEATEVTPSAAERRTVISDRKRPRRLWIALAAALLLTAAATVAIAFALTKRDNPTTALAQQPAEAPLEAPLDPLSLATPRQVVLLKKERREQLLAWLSDHNVWSRGAPMVQQTADKIDTNFDKLESFQVLLGSGLLRSHQATLLAAHPGGFFVFPLTAAEARTRDLKETALQWRPSNNPVDARRTPPRVELSELKIDDADRLDADKKVTGSIAYDVRGAALPPPFAVRLTLYNRGRRYMGLVWFTDRNLSGRGTLPFACPLHHGLQSRPAGPFVLFAELTTEVKGKLIVESNAAAILAGVAPPNAHP